MLYEFNTEDARLLIEDAAQSVYDDYDKDVPIDVRVAEVVEGYTMYYRDQLLLIAYYGLVGECFCGSVDYEDSPLSAFESDVYEAAVKLFEEKGEEVPE